MAWQTSQTSRLFRLFRNYAPPCAIPPPASRAGWLYAVGTSAADFEGNLHGHQVLQPPVRGHGLPDGARAPLGIPFAVFSMVPPYQSKSFHRDVSDARRVCAAVGADEIFA